MARDYSTEELRSKLLDSNDRFYLVDTLPADSYASRHLPGAISLPLELLDQEASKRVPNKDLEVIAYCASPR